MMNMMNKMNMIKNIDKGYYLRHRYDFVFLGLLIAAILLRLALISNNWPAMNSDEAVMGLMAKHMADGQGIPLVIYGQAYMGSLEAMFGSVFYYLFGPSIFALRLGLLVIFTLFLSSMYVMTRQLYDRQLALITTGLLCQGTPEIFLHQLFHVLCGKVRGVWVTLSWVVWPAFWPSALSGTIINRQNRHQHYTANAACMCYNAPAYHCCCAPCW